MFATVVSQRSYTCPMARSVEICMITTVDGAIDVNGRSGPLGGPPDQQRLAQLRRQADVILVGAGTAKAENYQPPSRPDLRIGVVTQSCNLDFTTALFTSGAGFIVTTNTAPFVPVDSVRAGESVIDFAGILDQLPEGIIHVEGGPMLNAALCDADVVDALNLTIAPHLVGVRGNGLTTAPHAPQHFELIHTQWVEGFVFVRYERTR
jgi:riboflavin biosynthesis pyrimidine reductase